MKTIRVIENQNILRVKLNRPDVRNAFNLEMIQELTQVFQQLQSRTDLRVVVIEGEGKAFCAGADLEYMKSMADFTLDENKQDARELFDLFAALASVPLPVVAVVQGAAFGGALGLMACADYVVIEEGAQLCFSEVKLGLVPAVISSFLVRKIAMGHLLPKLISGEIFGPDEALAMGLAHIKCLKNETSKKLEQICEMFCSVGPNAVRATKKLAQDLQVLPLEKHREQTSAVIAERRVSQEGQEGLKSYFAKRKAQWV